MINKEQILVADDDRRMTIEHRPISDQSIYLTILTDEVAIGNQLILEKDYYNQHDNEAIVVVDQDYCEGHGCGMLSDVYVANSVNTVARGTYSAGRIYDKFERRLLVQVRFIVRGCAIVEVLGEVIESTEDTK